MYREQALKDPQQDNPWRQLRALKEQLPQKCHLPRTMANQVKHWRAQKPEFLDLLLHLRSLAFSPMLSLCPLPMMTEDGTH